MLHAPDDRPTPVVAQMPEWVLRRDLAVAQFRRQVYAAWDMSGLPGGLLPFPHQAEWQLASEGWQLLDRPPVPGDYYQDIRVVRDMAGPGALVLPDSHCIVNDIACCTVRRALAPRFGGAARIVADLAAYKAGKSFGTAMWASGFACLPGARIHFVGIEYETAEPEFNYLAELLCSSQGMGMKPVKFHNDARGGRMILKLKTGAEYQVKSWTRKDNLKGKKLVAYIYCEAYQLPGLVCYTSVSQNLREQRGFALFPTTPDRPWVGYLHDQGHGADPYYHCTCSVDARENPFTYDQAARDRDDPAKGGSMTKETFDISWSGKLGGFVGRVYKFNRGDATWLFTPENHPEMYRDYDQVWD